MLCWVLIAAGRLSLVAENASYCLLTAPELLIALASLVAEQRLWGTRALRFSVWAQQFCCSTLVAPKHVESSVPCIGRRILNYWTHRSPSYWF